MSVVCRTALLVALITCAAANAQNNKLLQSANQAFQNNQHQQALQLYRQAQEAGISDPAVDYNIAVCLYRLNQYDLAADAFRPLAEQPRWAALAQYNLGLVYQAKGNSHQAVYWFQQAEQAQNPDKIRQLARLKLDQIQQQQVRKKSHNRLALLRIGTGYDDNPASATDETNQQKSSDGDHFNELMLYGHTYLTGHRNDGVKLYGMGFSKQYQDYQQYDAHLAGLGFMHERKLSAFDTGYGIQLTHIRADAGILANQIKLKLKAGYRSGKHYWQIALEPAYYAAGDNYQQIEGWQERLDISWQRQLDRASIKLRYRFEANQRDDLIIDNRFYSYSPTRQSLRTSLDWRLTSSWQLKWYSEYRDSQYQDQNSLTDSDGQFKQQQRENQQIQHQLQLQYQMLDNFNISGRFRYRDVDDNFQLYTYSKKEAALLLQLLL